MGIRDMRDHREPYDRNGCWYISISGRYQVPKLVRLLYAQAPVSLDRKQDTADRILAAEEPRRKPGPPSTFTSEQEKRTHYRKSGRERQRRYMEKKRRQTEPRRPGSQVDGHVRRRESHAPLGPAAARSFHLNNESSAAMFHAQIDVST